MIIDTLAVEWIEPLRSLSEKHLRGATPATGPRAVTSSESNFEVPTRRTRLSRRVAVEFAMGRHHCANDASALERCFAGGNNGPIDGAAFEFAHTVTVACHGVDLNSSFAADQVTTRGQAFRNPDPPLPPPPPLSFCRAAPQSRDAFGSNGRASRLQCCHGSSAVTY